MNEDVPALSTRDLTISFGGQVAVNAVTCAFHQGTLTAIVGPNGAGKTTYFNLISGQLRPTGGSVRLFGQDITRLGAPDRARARTRPRLPADQSLSRASRCSRTCGSRCSRSRRSASTVSPSPGATPRCATRRGIGSTASSFRRARSFRWRRCSHGDQRKLEVAILLALKPRVLMFDEPTAGMSLDEMPTILDLIEEIKARERQDRAAGRARMDVVHAARRPHHRAAGRSADRRRPAGRGGSAAAGAAGLSRRPRRRRIAARVAAMSDADILLRLEGVYTNIGRYRILHGVDCRCGAAASPRCLDATAPARPRRCAPSWAYGRRASARSCSRRSDHRAGNAAHRAPRHRLRAGEYGHLRQADGAREHAAGDRRAGFAQDQLDRVLQSFPALKMKWDSPAGSLSGGQKQMLAIGRAIIEPRRLLLIDEPTKGLSPAMVDQLVAALLRLKREQHHHPAGRAEFPRGGSRRRRCRGHGRGPHHPCRRDGGACDQSRAAAPALGLSMADSA